MYLYNLSSITCPRCGFTIPIYPNQKFVTCKNCEKKIKINEFEGEKEMIKFKKLQDGDLLMGINKNGEFITENINELLTDNDLYFAKVEPNAIIPSKREEDAGYDIYTCETETIVIPPCSTRMIDTGIAIACSKSYFPKFFDKGGMGSKGIIVGAGVGDSGYRDKYFIPLINTNENKYIVITNQAQKEIDTSNYFDLETKEFKYFEDGYFDNLSDEEYNLFFQYNLDKNECIIKPLNKAITQFVMLPVPKMNVKEISYEELKNIKSERGLGKLGSSGK